MKNLLSILFFTLSVLNLFGQNNLLTIKASTKSFPTNIHEGSTKELEKFNGEIVAFNGAIEQIVNSRNNTPFYKLKISDSNYLWTVLMFKNETNKIGDTIRVVGYLHPAEPNEAEKKILKRKIYGNCVWTYRLR